MKSINSRSELNSLSLAFSFSSHCCSHLHRFDLVIDFVVKWVEVANEVFLPERDYRSLESGLSLCQALIKDAPLGIEFIPLLYLLLDAVLFAELSLHFLGLFEGIGIDLFKNGLERDERLLENLVPMIFSQIDYNRHEHGEGLVFVRLEDVEEVVVFKEAHGSVRNLQVISADASDDSLEEAWDQGLNLFHFANLEHFLQFGQKERFFYAVGEGPILEQAIKKWNGKRAILCQEEHGASQELLVELTARLHLMKWDDHILEENHVLVSQRHGEAADNGGEDIKKLGRAVEFVSLMD